MSDQHKGSLSVRLPEPWVPVTDGLYDTESGNYLLFHEDGLITRPFGGWGLESGWVLARNAAKTKEGVWDA